MGVCSDYSSLLLVSEVKLATWSTSWQPPCVDRLSLKWPEWLSQWLFQDDSTKHCLYDYHYYHDDDDDYYYYY